ncbi:MAG: hypothetical protein M5R40_06230 [Anaerolineae bacterium]|nr:hypothetical protein [Anaerolineae bacterium]
MAARGDVTAQRRPLAERARDAAPALYTMDNTARDAVLSRYLYSEAGLDRLRRTSAEIGRRMLAAAEALREAPAAVQRWAALAADAEDADRMAESFDRIVAEAFASGDQVTLLNWIESARALADLLERDLQAAMTLALQRASRRLELLERRQYDEQHLQHFLKRDEQIAAVVDLLEGPDDAWALHLVGAGGVGKTMLLRYITARMAPARGAPTARIDFDYLNADYPSLAPGLILWSFAQELRAYDTTGRANELFDEADLLLSKLHQRLESRRAYRAGQATGDPLFRDAVELYVHALRALPQPIILIMDTCEELAKLRPDGTAPESVEATFRILRGLHDGPATLTDAPTRPDDGVPTLRVIFAGRRLLAGEGYGWWCDACDLEARPFLRLYEMQAFTDQDARAYLKDAGVAEALIPAIIARSSPAPRTVLNIEWAAARIAPAEAPRCNPYDLALYAAWASEDPPPSAGNHRDCLHRPVRGAAHHAATR